MAQVAQAAALGAAGVVLSADALEVEELKGLLGACCVAGVEAVVEASDGDALGRAGEASARIVCVRGVSSVEEAVELRSSIPKVTHCACEHMQARRLCRMDGACRMDGTDGPRSALPRTGLDQDGRGGRALISASERGIPTNILSLIRG